MHIPAVPAERSRPGMSTGRITTAALQIVDTEGSQALTMRRLGQALDRKVMTLYRYVPSINPAADGRPGLSPLAALGIRQRAAAGNGYGLGISLA